MNKYTIPKNIITNFSFLIHFSLYIIYIILELYIITKIYYAFKRNNYYY